MNGTSSPAIALRILTLVTLGLAGLRQGRAAEFDLDFIWTEAPFPSAHASTIVETADGDLVAAWFGGTDEGNPDVGIWSARREKGKTEWTAPVELFKEPKQPAWNPVLFRDPRDARGTIRLWFKIGPSPRDWTGLLMKSPDGGRSWGEAVWLPATMIGPVRNKPIVLSNGDILSGQSWESYRVWTSFMEISSDRGETWTRTDPILFGDMKDDMKGTIQPTMMEVRPGVVRAFFRTRGMGKISTALSEDFGRTWSAMTLTDLDHPGAGVDSVRLADGRCVLIYNPSARRRDPISLAVSHDGGETWADFLEIERLEKNQLGELSYPNIIQAADGDLHMVYTWNRRRIRHARVPLELVPEK